jgi:predicted transcriptional regulator of viral defense system
MRYIDLENLFKDFTIFSLSDIRRIDASFHRRRLNEWQDRGYIKKIIRGYYISSDLEIDEHVLFEIANRIYRPSYISLETALSYYHLIPESVYGISSASTRRTYTFKTPIGEFSYKTIKPQLFLVMTLLVTIIDIVR